MFRLHGYISLLPHSVSLKNTYRQNLLHRNKWCMDYAYCVLIHNILMRIWCRLYLFWGNRYLLNCLKAKRIVVGNYFVVPIGYLYKAIVWHGNNRFQYLLNRVRDYHRRNKGWSHYSVWLLIQEKDSSFFGLFFPVRSSFALVLGRYMNRVGVEDF